MSISSQNPPTNFLADEKPHKFSYILKNLRIRSPLLGSLPVSFNANKNMAFEIFLNESDKDKLTDKLTKLFTMNPITVHENRKEPRKKVSDTQSHNFQKR